MLRRAVQTHKTIGSLTKSVIDRQAIKELSMKSKTVCIAMILAFAVCASGAISAKGGNLPAPGEVRTYYQNGVQVGMAVHNQCTGEISIQGTVTSDYVGSFTVSC